MADITSYIAPNQLITGSVNPNNNILASTFSEGGMRFSELIDIDLSAVSDGALLIYDGTRSVFAANVLANNPHTIIDGGSYSGIVGSTILSKNSNIAGAIPTIANTEYGELTLNYADGLLYYRTAANTIDSFGAADQTITLTGDVTGSGTGSFVTTLKDIGSSGTYRSVTTDSKGRVASGTNPTTLAGYGITDAATSVQGGKADTALQPGAIGSSIEAWSANLDTWSGKTPYAGTITVTTGYTLAAGTGGTLGTAAYTNTGAYEVPLTFTSPLLRSTNTISLKGLTGFGTSGQTLCTNSTTDGFEWKTFASNPGTVTTVSVSTANGVSGSVDNPSSTPAITITLGAITPTSVNGLTLATATTGFTIGGGTTSKTLTVPLDASVSGTNTGDQTLSGLGGVPTSRTVAGHALTGDITISASDVGLSSVTNDAQTKASIVPNTTPSSGQILVGNAGGTAYAAVSTSGDATISSTGAISVTKVGGATLGTAAFTDSTAYDASGLAASAESAAKSYADGLAISLLDDRGNFNASVNTFPTTGGSGTSGAILKGDVWRISVIASSGDLLGYGVGSSLRAIIDTPGQTAANWALLEAAFPYIAENDSHRSQSIVTDLASTSQYPSTKAVYDWATSTFAPGASGTYEVPLTFTSPLARSTNTISLKGLTGFGTAGQTLCTNSSTDGFEWKTFVSNPGTVTTVSVATANGVSGSVSNPSSTPAITITLGAITPSSVNGLTLATATTGFTIGGGTTSKTLTVPLDASVSGTNTGDNAVNSNYSSLVSFPGFGTSHSTAAYGDHLHTGVYDVAGAAAAITLSGLGGVPTSRTVAGHALTADVTISASDVGLSSVTNDAQTKASIVPNTTPSSGQILVGNAGNTAYAAVSTSGDATIASTGSISVTKVGGSTLGTAAFTDSTAYATASHNQAESTITFTDITTGNASTTSHGFAPKAIAPTSGLLSVLAIGNGETIYSNKALFDTTNPAALGTAGPGSQLVAARRDHVHTMPSASDVGALPIGGGTLTGNLLFSTDNTLDIGATAATRPRSLYLGTGLKIQSTSNQIVTGAGANLTTVNFPASSGAVTITMPNTNGTVALAASTLAGYEITDALNVSGATVGATNQAQAFTNGVLSSTVSGSAVATNAITVKGNTATASGTNIAGGNVNINATPGTGTGASTITFNTGTTLTTGTTLQTSSAKMTILGSGNVGIGTTSPVAPLHIAYAGGDINSGGILRMATNTGSNDVIIKYGMVAGAGSAGYGFLQAGHSGLANDLTLALNPSGGNVGIGTSTPNSALTVVGAISASADITGTSITGSYLVVKNNGLFTGDGNGLAARNLGDTGYVNFTAKNISATGNIYTSGLSASTTFSPPQYTTALTPAISAATNGNVIYNTTQGNLNSYNSSQSAWGIVVNSDYIQNISTLTQAQYNALAGGPVATTFYIITDAPSSGTNVANIATKTADYTITSNDYCINVTASIPTTITLPSAIGLAGYIFIIKNSGTSTVTVVPAAGEFIDGSSTMVLGLKYNSMTVQSLGTSTGYIIT